MNCLVLLVLAFARESKLILWLSVWDLVDTEPFVGCPQQTRQMSLDIFDVIELGGQWIVDINDKDLPVGLLLIEQCHHAKHLDLLDLSGLGHILANLADIKRVIVALGFGLWVDDVGVFPCLPSYQHRSCIKQVTGCTAVPEGKRHNSTDSRGGGSNFGQIAACPS